MSAFKYEHLVYATNTSTKKYILTNNNSTCINSINIVGLYIYIQI